MTEYTQYYTSADSKAYFENQSTSSLIQIDTLSSIGWNEQMSSGPIYGLGNQTFSFINKGNTITSGVIEVAFTDEKYFHYVFESLAGGSGNATKPDINTFQNGSKSKAMAMSSQLKAQKGRPKDIHGIHLFPAGFDIRVVLNNQNIFREDDDKTFLIKDCKIVSRQFGVSVSQGGAPVSMSLSFIAKTVQT